MKRLIIPVAISILFAASAQADGINNQETGYGAYGQSNPSPTSTLTPQSSYGPMVQQAIQTGLQALSGANGTGIGATSGTGTGLDLGAGSGSSSAFGTGIGTTGSLGGTSIGTAGNFGGSTSSTSSFGSSFGTATGTTGGFGATGGTSASNSFSGFGSSTTGVDSGLGTGSILGTGTGTGLGSGLGNPGGVDSSINPTAPAGIGPALGAPDATAGDTTLPDTNNTESAMPTSPFAKPPASAEDSAPSATPSSTKADTPLRRALSALRLGNYDQSLTMLNQILQSDPGNSQAHYLKAVAFVMTRHYSQAGDEYRQCLQLNPAPDIANRARAGLAKLSH